MCKRFLRSRNEYFSGSKENTTDVRATARQHGIEDHVKFIIRDSVWILSQPPRPPRETSWFLATLIQDYHADTVPCSLAHIWRRQISESDHTNVLYIQMEMGLKVLTY